MKQEVDVMTVFKKGHREPKPVKFRMIEDGRKLTVDVVDVINYEYIGSNRIDFECNALSLKGNLVSFMLQYFRNEGRWLLSVK